MNPLLIAAADLIERHAATLNDTTSVCPCCGVTKYEKRWEQQARVELEAMVRKLRTRYRNVEG